MPNPTVPNRPLEGIRVLDFTRVLSGPICTRMLSDLGAEVVKVEPPESDIFRSTPPHVGGLATMYAQYNVGKRNLSVDLKNDAGAGLLLRLAAEADVIVENFRPGVLARHGLGAEALRARDPELIYCSITGWGQEGPWADRPAYAPIVQAEAGTLALGGALRRGPIRGEIMQHADLYAGMMACNAVLSALFHRARGGGGQHLDVAMGEALLYINEHGSAELAGLEGSRGFETWFFESYELANGRCVHILGDPVQSFPLLAPALGMKLDTTDARFSTPEARQANREALVAALADRIGQVENQGALESLFEGLPMVIAGVRTTGELAATEWARERKLTTDVAAGFPVPTAPFRSMDLEIGVVDPRVASRGEDNRGVLEDWLGLDPEACQALEDQGVLEASASEPPTLEEAPRKAFRTPRD